ncbi:Lrp/AsnC family transcriptional regulator [Glycomyces scopariae]
MHTFRTPELDDVDWLILAELQSDARLSYKELSRRVHLSAPAVGERVRRLEESGAIAGYAARVDPAKAGQPILAFIQLRCKFGRCLLKTSAAEEYPEVTEVHKLSGEHCSMLKVRATSLAHFEGFVEKLGQHGDMRTHIVLSTPYEDPTVAPAPPDRDVSDSDGWSGR